MKRKLIILISFVLLAFIAGFVGAGTFTKGFLGKEDICLWDGTAVKTSTRSSSTGYSLTLHDFDWVGVDVLQVYGAGINRTSATIASALTGVGAVNKVGLWLSPGAWVITADHAFTANTVLVCPPGVDLQIGAGKTVTVQGSILAGRYQIKSGAGTLTITGVFIKHDQWEDGAGNAYLPTTNNTVDLGSDALEYHDGWFDGTLYADALDLNGTGITATGAEINRIAGGITATAAEVNTIADGITATASQVNGLVGVTKGFVNRPKFTWKDADEIYISAGGYEINGKYAYWISQLTSDIGSPGVSDWYYLYLDDSEIAASGLIDTTKLIWANTEPAWSETLNGWYNGNDRCIFAVLTDGASNILEFFHDESLVLFADQITDRANADLDDTWTDITLSIPKFATKAQVTFGGNSMGTDAADAYWRTNGQAAVFGHEIYAISGALTQYAYNTLPVITDATQKIEVIHSHSNDCRMLELTDGWYFPRGM